MDTKKDLSSLPATPAGAADVRAPELGVAPGSAWMSDREHDLIIALRQLCEATEKQCAANAGKESIIVRMKRNNAKKTLAKYEPLSSPNIASQPTPPLT